MKITFRDLGMMDYRDAWQLQESLFNESLRRKMENRNTGAGAPPENHLLFCEHPHVYTIGKSGRQQNLLIGEDRLKEIGASVYRVDRGGDITYHGPGQLVGYPIFDLEALGLSVKDYVHLLEECIIGVLSQYSIVATRLPGATGVWLDAGTPHARKICAMGIRASRHITMHGFALNVNPDLRYFSWINPCGFTDKGVTSISREMHADPAMKAVADGLLRELSKAFHFSL